MAASHSVYRTLVRLYPSAFRHEYGEDLVAHYGDLVADRGARAARARTALDLAITIPRYHLEHVMTDQHSTTVLGLLIGLFAAGGLASLMTGVGPPQPDPLRRRHCPRRRPAVHPQPRPPRPQLEPAAPPAPDRRCPRRHLRADLRHLLADGR